MNKNQRLIIGITGASGIIYGVRLLQLLKELPLETHVVVSESAERARIEETTFSRQDLRDLATICYSYHDIGAAIASGSFKTMGMIIAPCSMRSLAEIANGIGSNLISRAADVVLKERRRLVLMVRESPLHAVHLKNMLTVTEMGGIIAPPVPAFYNKPQTLTDIIDHSLGRTLDLFNFDLKFVKRWGENKE